MRTYLRTAGRVSCAYRWASSATTATSRCTRSSSTCSRKRIVTFDLPNHWVWDFWIADDGTDFHLYYLHAPNSLGDPHLRHRNAKIGHATSPDLANWRDHGPVLGPGTPR
jgi:sucrose-6-phosphate hydrolase SacC (GH32 family)